MSRTRPSTESRRSPSNHPIMRKMASGPIPGTWLSAPVKASLRYRQLATTDSLSPLSRVSVSQIAATASLFHVPKACGSSLSGPLSSDSRLSR